MAECSLSQCVRRRLKRKHRISALRWLEVDCDCYCTLTDSDFRFLRKMSAGRLKYLQGIHIYYTAITDKTVKIIADIIACHTSIKECVITAGRVTIESYRALAEALHSNTSLSMLRINCNAAYTPEVDAFFLEALNINPRRPVDSCWSFIDGKDDAYRRITSQMVVVKKESTELSRLSDAYSAYWQPSGSRRR